MGIKGKPGVAPGPDDPRATGQPGGQPAYNVAAVSRALGLLDILGRSGPASLADIARLAGCTRTAAFRLLRTMAAHGYVAQDEPRGLWRLGDRFAALRGTASEASLPERAAPVMERLARETGMVVYILHRQGAEAVLVALCQTDPSQRRYGEVGTSFPLHAGCGRLLLAFAPEHVQASILAGRLSRFSPQTITDPRRLAADSPRIRERGWFSSHDELMPGSAAFSAPIRDASGAVDWMLTVSWPTIRMRDVDRRALTRAVTAAAEDISALLAGPGTG